MKIVWLGIFDHSSLCFKNDIFALITFEYNSVEGHNNLFKISVINKFVL